MAVTKETLAALKNARAQVNHLVDGATDDILTAWLHALKESKAELQRVIESDEWDAPDRAARLEASQKVIAQNIREAAQHSVDTLTPAAQRMVDLAVYQQEALIGTQLPKAINVSFTRPDPAGLTAIVERTTQQITVRHWHLSEQAVASMNTALRVGIAGGQNPTEVAQRMVNGVEGAFNGGIGRATVIARTEILDAHREASFQSRKENADILEGWTWHAELDSNRTCISCIAQHGTTHPVDEPGPLDHHQGRCTALPKTLSWKDLGFDIDEPEDLDIQTGEDWFNNLPEEKQRAILGPTRYEAWQDGRFPINQWSQRRTTEGWRDAYHEGKPADAATGQGPSSDVAPNMRKKPNVEAVTQGVENAHELLERVHGKDFMAEHWTQPTVQPLPHGVAGRRDERGIKISHRAKYPKATTLHEFGHELDAKLLSDSQRTQALNAIRESQTYKALRSAHERYGPDSHANYMLSDRELTARAYAQWAATKTNDEAALRELQKMSRAGMFQRYRQWPPDDFEGIMAAYEDIFRR